MHHLLPPLLIAGLLPLAWLAFRLGLLGGRRGALVVVAAVAAAVAASTALSGGTDFLYLKRMDLLLAASAGLVVLLHRHRLGAVADRRVYLAALAALALVGAAIHSNFLAFHGQGTGQGTYVHLHDVAHYYLGAKYYREVGHPDLYTAMLRAEAELHDDHFRTTEARDLRSYAIVHVRSLLRESEPVKAAFTPERWRDFQLDVDLFRRRLSAEAYGEVLRDHGFNATPVLALVGAPLASLVPAGSYRGVWLLTLLDPLLLILAFAAVVWAFGVEAALLAFLYHAIAFGATFGWTGGSFLRFAWVAATVVALSCLERGRHASAGALLALAAGLTIFPAALALALLIRAGAVALRDRRPERGHVRFAVGLAASGLLLLAATSALPRGLRHWQEFGRNMQAYLRNAAYNNVGLIEVLSFTGPERPQEPVAVEAERERRRLIETTARVVLLPLVALFLARRARDESDASAAVMGILLVFAGVSIAAYYYVILLVLVLPGRDREQAALALFAAELASYALLLFEDRPVVLFFYRNVLVLALLLLVFLDRRRADLGGDRQARPVLAGVGRVAGGRQGAGRLRLADPGRPPSPLPAGDA